MPCGFLPSGQRVGRKTGSISQRGFPQDHASVKTLIRLDHGYLLKCQHQTNKLHSGSDFILTSLRVSEIEQGILSICLFIYHTRCACLLSPDRELANEDATRNKLGTLFSSCSQSFGGDRYAKVTCELKCHSCPDCRGFRGRNDYAGVHSTGEGKGGSRKKSQME